MQALSAGQRVTVGVPAEAVNVSVDEGAPSYDSDAARANAWRGTVESVEPDYGRQIQFVGFRSGEHKLVGQAGVFATGLLRVSRSLPSSTMKDSTFLTTKAGARIA